MSQQCSFCGHAHLREVRARYLHQQGDDLLIVDDVPCLQCEYCGEQYFAIATLKKIEQDHTELAAGRKHPARTISVPVELFQSL